MMCIKNLPPVKKIQSQFQDVMLQLSPGESQIIVSTDMMTVPPMMVILLIASWVRWAPKERIKLPCFYLFGECKLGKGGGSIVLQKFETVTPQCIPCSPQLWNEIIFAQQFVYFPKSFPSLFSCKVDGFSEKVAQCFPLKLEAIVSLFITNSTFNWHSTGKE